jgi:hypothetical protein
MSKSRWEQIAASGGLLFVILAMGGQGLIQVGGSEPAFNAPAADILSFFETRDPLLYNIGGYMVSLSFIALIWFLGAVWARLQRYEQGSKWMSLIAVGSAFVGLAVSSATTGWPMAVFRIEEGLDPQLARYLFDDGNFGFALLWVYLAGFLLATGIVALRDGALPGWLGWYALVTSIALLIGRAFWDGPSGLVFIPYVLASFWIIVTSIFLIRAARRVEDVSPVLQAEAA